MNTQPASGLAITSLSFAALSGAAFGQTVVLQNGTATFSQSFDRSYSPAESIDGLNGALNGWAIYSPSAGTSAQTAVWETASDVTTSALKIRMQFNHGTQHLLGKLRFSVTNDDRSLFADGLANGGDVTANWTPMGVASVTVPGGMGVSVSGETVLLLGTAPVSGAYDFTFVPGVSAVTGIRLEALEEASLPTDGPGLQPTNGNFVLTELNVEAVPEPATFAVLALGAAMLVRRKK